MFFVLILLLLSYFLVIIYSFILIFFYVNYVRNIFLGIEDIVMNEIDYEVFIFMILYFDE